MLESNNIMRLVIALFFLSCTFIGATQTKVTETLQVDGQRSLELDLDFADDILIKVWDKAEVFVEVEVSINDGEDDDLFALETRTTNSYIEIRLDDNLFDQRPRGRGRRDCWQSDLYYTVHMPANLELRAETISGNFILSSYGQPTYLKTISGDIDLTVKNGLDFKAKTVSGEVYSDIDIKYPYGKEGLRQIVGMDVKGVIQDGGETMNLETISGDIFLRKE